MTHADERAAVLQALADWGHTPDKGSIPLADHILNTLHVARRRAEDVATCPQRETVPNPCRCPCQGCKFNCAAHSGDA